MGTPKHLSGLIAAAGIAAALALLAFWVGVPGVSREPQRQPPPTPHRYKDSGSPLTDVRIVAVYFVPRNRTAVAEDWRERLTEGLDELRRFHELQLQGRARLTYKIYPQPIVGREDGRTYDTDVTDNGNPAALRQVSAELEGRLFDPTGDLYRPGFTEPVDGAKPTVVILYEGVGAAGAVGEPAAILSRLFLTRPEYRTVRSSLLAHEFYHTLGLPDAYLGAHATPTDMSLMGQGRFRPLATTYLNPETLDGLGL